LTAPDGSTDSYQYDTLNRLSTLTDSQTGQFSFGYDALSRRTSLTRPNGISTSYSYDSLSRLLSVLHQAGGATLDGASYTYDNAGNRTSKTNYLDGTTSNYSYDALYQLLQVTQGSVTSETYSYDAVGNRLSSLSVPGYNYNASNELTSTSAGTYTYDANGNTLTDASGKQYTWDFENRLTQVVNQGVGTTTFRYDPFGRRIQKSGPLGTTNYLYDGDDLIVELDSAGSLLARYTHGQGTDQPLAELRSTTASFYEQDGLGSVTSLTSSAAALSNTNTYAYDSFGKLTTSTGTLVNPFQYTAREFDAETGTYYYRARYYDQTLGRFTGEDPARFDADSNFYRYVRNMPLVFGDPSGLFPTALHRQWTYDLALAVFGFKCADKARAVADANAATDALPGFWPKIQFALFMGEGWRKGGPHFPDPNKNDLGGGALNSCSLTDLGKALHSRQDYYAHRGATPLLHYLTLTTIDDLAASDPATVDAAMQDSMMLLQEFKKECLKCCQ
jgi:RHS repeat-associated protein